MSVIRLSLPSGAHIISSCINQYSIHNDDHHINYCYIVRFKRNECQVHPTTSLTANKHIAVQETGHIYAFTKGYTAKGTATGK